MSRFAVRAAGAWFVMPFALKVAALVALLVALLLTAVAPALALEPDPFRWRS